MQEQYDTYRDEMSEIQETVEMSALDKEMAEERAEELQDELKTVQEKYEELSASSQLLKAELESGGGASAEGVSSYQLKQLEQQNEKLKEALVRSVSPVINSGVSHTHNSLGVSPVINSGVSHTHSSLGVSQIH